MFSETLCRGAFVVETSGGLSLQPRPKFTNSAGSKSGCPLVWYPMETFDSKQEKNAVTLILVTSALSWAGKWAAHGS